MQVHVIGVTTLRAASQLVQLSMLVIHVTKNIKIVIHDCQYAFKPAISF